MPADLESRLREVLRPGPPPLGSEERMLNRLVASPGRTRRPRRRPWAGTLAAAAMIAVFAVFLVLIIPRGEPRRAPMPPAAFAVLNGGGPSELAALDVTVDDLNFPGMEASTLRTVRRVGRTTVIAGRNRDGLVCLVMVGPEPGSAPAPKPGEVTVIHVRAFTVCGLTAAVERSALVQTTWEGSARQVLLVPDGVRLRGPDGPIPVTRNVAVLEPGVRAVMATYRDGTVRRLRTDERTTLPLGAADRAAITEVRAPDLTGLRFTEVFRLLDASLLTGGTPTATTDTGLPAGRVVRQSPAPGTAVPVGTAMDVVVAAPGGARSSPPAATPLLVDDFAATPNSPAFRRTTLGALRGSVRVLVFARNRAEASSARWVPQTGAFGSGTIVVFAGDRDAAARSGTGNAPAALAVDADGALQAAFGVRAPATVVLDRDGRVAVRSDRLPIGPLPDPALDLDAVITVLQLEPRTTDVAATPIPRHAWWLTMREPLDPAEVPGAVPLTGSCAAERERVWSFGPAGGERVWISVSANPGLDGALAQVVAVAPVRPGPRAPLSIVSCEPFPPARDASGPAIGVWTEDDGTGARSLLVVRPGYDRVEADGRSYPVVNGLVSIPTGDITAPGPMVFIGPAGRAVMR